MAAEPAVAAVVIGRNEGERLMRCLRSAEGLFARVVYVDSGSTDGSPDRARAAGAEVVALDPALPFTAARASNAGVAALGAAAPPLVQFVDGDCEILPGWVETAAAFLATRPDVAVVCGRRRERHRDATLWNRLCDMEWDTPAGEARACGGDATIRTDALRAVGGFRADLIAGEEPELCLRLRRAGWKVWRLDRDMTLHDAAMTSPVQWWRRSVRAGWAYAEGAALHGRAPERYRIREVRRLVVWGGAVPGGIALLLAVGAVVPGPAGGTAFALAALAAAGWGAMALRIALRRRASHGDAAGDALRYGLFTMLGKIAEAEGAVRHGLARRLGRPARLIEYKSGATPHAAPLPLSPADPPPSPPRSR